MIRRVVRDKKRLRRRIVWNVYWRMDWCGINVVGVVMVGEMESCYDDDDDNCFQRNKQRKCPMVGNNRTIRSRFPYTKNGYKLPKSSLYCCLDAMNRNTRLRFRTLNKGKKLP